MSIATEISRIKDAKDAIRASIIAKGVNVPQAAKLDTYADRIDEIVQTASGNMEVVTSSPSGTINAADNKFYMLSGDAGALVFNLPAMQQGGHGIYLLMTTASTSVVSFTSEGSVTINFPAGFQVEADKCYLMDFEFAQSAWQVSVEEWFVNGGGSDKFEAVLKGIMNRTLSGDVQASDFPDGVTVFKTHIFNGCPIKTVEVPSTVTSLESGWCTGTQLRYIKSNSITTLGDSSFREIDVPAQIVLPNVTSIGAACFQSMRSLKKLVLGPVTQVGPSVFNGLGTTNYLPTLIDTSNWTIKSFSYNTFSMIRPYKLKMSSVVTNVGSGFLNAYGADCYTILEMNATTPPTLSNKFSGNYWLPIFVPSSSIDSYKTASNWSAYADLYRPHGYAITGVKAEVWDKTNKTIVTVPLNGSGVLEESEIRVGAGVTVANQSYVFIGPDVTELGSFLFYGSNARCIDFTNATSLSIIRARAMGGQSTSAGMQYLSEVDLTPTQLTTIESSSSEPAFGFDTLLTTVKLPSTVTSLGSNTFHYCTSLLDFYCYATVPPSFNNCFSACTIMNTKDPDQASIYVPAASVDAYKSASGWSAYAAIIKPMPTE